MPQSKLSPRILGCCRAVALAFVVVLLAMHLLAQLAYFSSQRVVDLVSPEYHDACGSTGRGDDEVFSIALQPALQKNSLKESSPSAVNSCSKIMIYLPEKFSSMGIGNQLNNYLLSTIIAAYLDRKLVILERPGKDSQFGCPTSFLNDTTSPPSGLSRIIQPLAGECYDSEFSRNYTMWFSRADEDEKSGPTLTAFNTSDGRSVWAVGGGRLRRFFMGNRKLFFRTIGTWIKRSPIHATKAQVDSFSNRKLADTSDSWDQVVSLLHQRGMMKLQPWVVSDVQERLATVDFNPKDPYTAIHVRRGDKLKHESKSLVQGYWRSRGYNETTQPLNYIPLAHYLKQLDDSCPRTIYIATDDPITIREEIAALNATSGFNFVLTPKPEASQGHVKTEKDCTAKYDKTISMVMDLYLLVHASVFVGEFNSNWGRLVTNLRVHFPDVDEPVMGTAKPREVRVAFGDVARDAPGI